MNLARAAQAYAGLGWAVLPLKPKDKIPLIPRARGGQGVLDATTDAEKIGGWWSRWPAASVGLAMGGASGEIFALDIDPRNGGDESLALLLEQHGKLPDTVEALTGGGGRHIILRGGVRGTVLAPGIDVKSTGGYIVAPPSIHPNGRPYVWEASSRPDEVQVALAPDWLMKMLGAKRPHLNAYTHSSHVDPESFVLGRAFKAAGWLGREVRPGVFAALCPNRNDHSTGEDFDSSTVLFAPEPNRRRGRFYCSHEHCREVWR